MNVREYLSFPAMMLWKHDSFVTKSPSLPKNLVQSSYLQSQFNIVDTGMCH